MKICILTSSYPVETELSIGGIASFERDIAIKLAQKGNDIHVITPRQPGKDFNDDDVFVHRFSWGNKNKGVELSSLKIFSIKGLISIISVMFNGQITLYKLHKKYKFDILFAMWAVPAGFWSYIHKKITKTPYITWTLGSDIWDYGRNTLTKPVIKAVLRNSDKIFSDGFMLGKETTELAGKECSFLASTRDLSEIKSHSDFPKEKNKKNFIFVGRYHKNKGPDILLDAIKGLPDRIIKESQFHFFGGGEMESKLKQNCQSYGLDNVFINDFVGPEEIVGLLSGADYLIIPSREDSIPVILSDALQFQLPVIASQVGDTGELVQKYRIGFVFENENIVQLTGAIVEAFSKPKIDFTANFCEILELFDFNEVIATLDKTFKLLKE